MQHAYLACYWKRNFGKWFWDLGAKFAENFLD